MHKFSWKVSYFWFMPLCRPQREASYKGDKYVHCQGCGENKMINLFIFTHPSDLRVVFLDKTTRLAFFILIFQLKMTLISPAIGIIKRFTRWELFNKVRPLILLATERFSRMFLRVYLHFAVICPQSSCFVWHVFCVILQFHHSQLKVHFHWGEDYILPRSTTHERVNLAYTHTST